VPFIVGLNPNSPSKPHSAPAHGGNDVETINTDPENNAYTIYGALVGGPDRWDRYFDIRNDWPQSEVALDYNAPLLTLASMHTLSATKDPYYVQLQEGAYLSVKPSGIPCDAVYPEGCRAPAMNKGAKIAMAVCLTVVSLVVFGLSGYYIFILIRNAKEGTEYTA
jgi:endoglucanase